MHIRFARPITKLIGVQDCTITVRQSVTLREVVDILAQKFAHTQIFQVNSKGAAGNLPPLSQMLAEYYRSRGWDDEGRPTQETLKRLNLQN